MTHKIKDLPVSTQEQRNEKESLSGRAQKVGLDDNATEAQVEAKEKKS